MIAAALLWIRSNRLIATLIGVSGLALAVIIVWQVGLMAGAHRETTRRAAADAAAVAKVEHRNSAALEAAASQRRTDEASAAATEKELTDAVEALPDSVPSARRVALGCARLRRAGQDTSSLPQCA